MPKKRPGLHNAHVKITKRNFRTLQEYCNAGAERLFASDIMDLLMQTYIEDHLAARMNRGEGASWKSISEDIPKVASKVAHKIEPAAFEEPAE